MVNMSRRRRYWQRWWRYNDYLCRFGPNMVASRGIEKVMNQRARYENLKIWRNS